MDSTDSSILKFPEKIKKPHKDLDQKQVYFLSRKIWDLVAPRSFSIIEDETQIV